MSGYIRCCDCIYHKVHDFPAGLMSYCNKKKVFINNPFEQYSCKEGKKWKEEEVDK